jgi:hypothetical protein
MPFDIKEFLTEDKIIHINEWNSGTHTNKEFVRVLNEIMNLINIKLSTLPSTKKISEYNPYILIEYQLTIASHSPIVNDNSGYIKKLIKIVLIGSDKRAGQISDIYLNGGTYLDNSYFIVRIGINNDKTIKEIQSSIDSLKPMMSHELVHVFQNLYNNYQKTQAYVNRLNKNAPIDDTGEKHIFNNPDYWSSRHEIEAYITQINGELKNIKKDNKDITFKSAILKSQGWRDFMTHVPLNKREKIQRKMLSKIAHYWTSQLKGKLNEMRKLNYREY